MTFSPQYLVAINLLLLALISYSGSSIVATVIGGKLEPPIRVTLPPPPEPIAQQVAKALDQYEVIWRRDIFNSRKEATPPPVVAQSAPPPNLKLWGVAVHADPASSYAIIEDQKVRKQVLYRINDTIEGTDLTVKRIGWGEVVLARGDQEQLLGVEQPGGPGGALASLRPSAGIAAPQVSDQNIQMIDENEYLVDRAELDHAFENMSQLFTQIRAVPHFEGGRSTGFRLFAIRQGSLFDRIGLKNGDIIQRINETDLTDPSRALSLMQELRNEKELTVEVIRNRQPRTLHYRFR